MPGGLGLYKAVPDDALYLEFPRSEGTSSRWPLDKLDPTPNDQGEVNFMRPIASNESLSIKWRTQIGTEVARLLGLPDHKKYLLRTFPEGYKFYHHNKGSVHDPRMDPYLYGSPSGRYRSPPEFIRHAHWLMTDDTLDRKNCGCKYCGTSKQSQKEISHDLGIKSGLLPDSSRTNIKPKVRHIVQPRTRHSPSGSVVNHDRTADMRAPRRFRPGELVWCALSPLIQGEHNAECIEFWPGLVNEGRLKTIVLPHEPGEPWRVLQSIVYKVKLLGVMHSYVLSETAILPYQAYGPSVALIEHLRFAGDPTLLQDWSKLAEFQPIPLSAESDSSAQLRFVEASTPFTLAIQIAAHLVRMWTPTDEWKFHGELPHPPTATPDPAQEDSATVEMIETRYQGLWWGAERIWADELVRLQPARAQIVPQGSQVIYRASPRADGRGVLMRINSIMAVPEGAPKDVLRDCKVAGVLYELADETHEEGNMPEAVAITQGGPVSNSVGPSLSPSVKDGSVAPTDTLLTPANGAGPSTHTSITQIPPASPNPINFPNLPSYPLPIPPRGYKFRQILKPGYEIVLDVSLIAGRYYPDLLTHPLLQNALADVNPVELRVPQLTALCGLLPGAVNSMECMDWHGSRLGMIKSADIQAQQDLHEHWRMASLIEDTEEHASGDKVQVRNVELQDVQMKDIEV